MLETSKMGSPLLTLQLSEAVENERPLNYRASFAKYFRKTQGN